MTPHPSTSAGNCGPPRASPPATSSTSPSPLWSGNLRAAKCGDTTDLFLCSKDWLVAWYLYSGTLIYRRLLHQQHAIPSPWSSSALVEDERPSCIWSMFQNYTDTNWVQLKERNESTRFHRKRLQHQCSAVKRSWTIVRSPGISGAFFCCLPLVIPACLWLVAGLVYGAPLAYFLSELPVWPGLGQSFVVFSLLPEAVLPSRSQCFGFFSNLLVYYQLSATVQAFGIIFYLHIFEISM